MHYVALADNVDHNVKVRTLDGQGTFMGWVSYLYLLSQMEPFVLVVIMFLPLTSTRLTVTDVTKGRSVPIVHFSSDDGQGLESVCMRPRVIKHA